MLSARHPHAVGPTLGVDQEVAVRDAALERRLRRVLPPQSGQRGPQFSTARHHGLVDIVSALFVEDFALRQAPGPSTRIDLTGAFFSLAAPSPVPVTITPHLVVLIRCRADEPGNAILEAVFRRGDDEIARNVSPFTVEPGKFTYRLVRGELEFADYGLVEAHCRVDQGPVLVVPLTLLPPAEEAGG